MGGISVWQLLIVLAIVLLLFGAKKLRNVGSDLGSAVKGFKSAVKEGEAEAEAGKDSDRIAKKEAHDDVIDVEVKKTEDSTHNKG